MLHAIVLQICAISIMLLTACSYVGLENPFRSDPFTGGENAASSILLDVRIPAGMQRYSSHGYISTGANGEKEGLETFRGNISPLTAALDLFNELHPKGWQLRLSLRKGDRSVWLYQKDNELALLTFHRQGMLVILEIWAGSRLPDGVMPDFSAPATSEEPHVELPGEEYGPLEEKQSPEKPGTVEQWGSALEEREL